MDTHDPVRQLTYFRQALSQNKKPIGFLLAAGCPLAVGMPKDAWPLIPDIAGLTKFVRDELKSADAKPAPFDVLLGEMKKGGSETPNIEEILSFIRGLKQISTGAADVRGLTESELCKLEKDVCTKIVSKTCVDLPNKATPYHHLAQWIQLIDRDEYPIECFTTNYDLLLEQAFEETGVPYFDGFVGARRPFFDLRAIEDSLIPQHWTRLWKVHGSINWFLTADDAVYRSFEVGKGESYLIHPSHLKYDESRKMPYLALIDRLNAFLRQPGAALITTGYSFSDIHLNNTINTALRANPTAMVFALMFGSYKDAEGDLTFKKAFDLARERPNLSVWTYDQAVIGGRQGRWDVLHADALHDDDFGGAIVESKREKVGDHTMIEHELRLGDFAKLGSFLQAMIGTQRFKAEDAK